MSLHMAIVMTPDVYKQQIVVVPRNAADNSPDLELQLSSSRLSSVLSSARGGARVTLTRSFAQV